MVKTVKAIAQAGLQSSGLRNCKSCFRILLVIVEALVAVSVVLELFVRVLEAEWFSPFALKMLF